MPRTRSEHLGESLIGNKRAENNRRHNTNTFVTINEKALPQIKERTPLVSITQQCSLDEFISLAQMAERDFTADRPDYKIVVPRTGGLTQEQKNKMEILHTQLKDYLRIPRRPPWERTWTKEVLDRKEKDYFLDWRRTLSILQSSHELSVTPYERNIDLWRQLWRVVEKCHLVVQLVDARHPLLFRCEDLEKYVKEVDERKQTLLLINKADLLTSHQRMSWHRYFCSIGVCALFWSALNGEKEGKVTEEWDILSADELLIVLLKMGAEVTDDMCCIGMIGYPNVGKSSTINALINEKKTAVSATPGRTKHLQTHIVTVGNDKLMLCDCPGLVMPNFVTEQAELVLCSVLPPAQLIDHMTPAMIIIERIPIHILERFYSITFVESTNPSDTQFKRTEDLLGTLCVARNWMSKRRPNYAKAALRLVKDYSTGSLIYCHPPPNVSIEDYLPISGLTERIKRMTVRNPPKEHGNPTKDALVNRFDQVFFSRDNNSVGYGLMSHNPMERVVPKVQDSGKAWKNRVRNPKRKLRVVFAHLDQI